MSSKALEISSNAPRATGGWDDLLTPEQQNLPAPRFEERHDNLLAEEVERHTAELHQQGKPMHWEGQERWQGEDNERMRLVNILTPEAVFTRLRRAGVDATAEPVRLTEWGFGVDGQPKLLTVPRSRHRLWLNDFSRVGRVGVNAWLPRNGKLAPVTVTTLQYQCGPEWSLMRFDRAGVPTEERYRGWRTALLKLITEGVLTEAEVNRAFPPPVLNAASELYRATLFRHRAQSRGWVAA